MCGFWRLSDRQDCSELDDLQLVEAYRILSHEDVASNGSRNHVGHGGIGCETELAGLDHADQVSDRILVDISLCAKQIAFSVAPDAGSFEPNTGGLHLGRGEEIWCAQNRHSEYTVGSRIDLVLVVARLDIDPNLVPDVELGDKVIQGPVQEWLVGSKLTNRDTI